MGGKNLIEKLKTEIIGASLIGISYFNSFNVNAGENYNPRYNTTTHYIIKEIQKEDSYVSLKTLDKIIDQSKRIITKRNYTEQEAKVLMKKINSEIIEKYSELNDSIQSCYRKAITYLAIGEANNLPLYGLIVPSHMLIRWDSDGRHNPLGIALNSRYIDPEDYSMNKGDFNWDPNIKDYITDEKYFYEGIIFNSGRDPFGYGEIREGIYLKNLNKKEIFSLAYQQESIDLFEKNLYDSALEYIDKAIELNPKNHMAYYFKGDYLCSIGQKKCKEESDSIILNLIYEKYFKEAHECYKKSLNFFSLPSPTSAGIYFNLGKMCTDYLKKYDEAENYLTRAIEERESFFQDTKLKRYILERAKLYELTGQKEKKEKDLEKIREIDSRFVKSYTDYIPRTAWGEIYPQGITEQIFNEENKKIIQRVRVNDKKVDVYKKIIYPWQTFYKKNDTDISNSIWEIETKSK